MAVTVDKEKCTGCGECVPNCPVESLSIVDNLCVCDEDTCADCGACVDVCPTEALSL